MALLSSPYDAVNYAEPFAGANRVNAKDILLPSWRDSVNLRFPVSVVSKTLYTIDQNGMTISHGAILAGPV